jgi:hypothetical protein
MPFRYVVEKRRVSRNVFPEFLLWKQRKDQKKSGNKGLAVLYGTRGRGSHEKGDGDGQLSRQSVKRASANEVVVLSVRADPKPQIAVGNLYGERPILAVHAGRPERI